MLCKLYRQNAKFGRADVLDMQFTEDESEKLA